MVQDMQAACSDCNGEGEVLMKEIDAKASKVCMQETKLLEVHVDKGMVDGQKIYFRGDGNQQPGVEPGDVIILLQQLPHEEMAVIFVRQVPGEVIQPGCIKGVAHEGMPVYKNPFEKRNLYIKFSITFPENHFTDVANLKVIERLRPPRPVFKMPTGDNVEEADLHDYDPNAYRGAGAVAVQRLTILEYLITDVFTFFSF
ncbi:dnaJ homolog subfamily A member 2 [Trichonephila clavipes]|nr:dnaJ homolog subfamily A member 2 [Trichonephila clavipes]